MEVQAAASFGFAGKLPARGDFVRAGLPGSFARPWDAWLQRVLAGSQQRLGAAWLPAWLEAPVWRFALAPGLCGAGGALGVLLPSVDSVGRYFPLTLAAVWPAGQRAADCSPASGWLDDCEQAGIAALQQMLPPDALLARLARPPCAAPAGPDAGGVWWTAGAPRVPDTQCRWPDLPDTERFVAMLVAEQKQASASF